LKQSFNKSHAIQIRLLFLPPWRGAGALERTDPKTVIFAKALRVRISLAVAVVSVFADCISFPGKFMK